MNLRPYTAALMFRRRRLQQLVELTGGLNQEDPLQAINLRHIAWLEGVIAEEKERREKEIAEQKKRAAP